MKMNREQRRKIFREHHKKMDKSWKEWNAGQPKDEPYINYDKRK